MLRFLTILSLVVLSVRLYLLGVFSPAFIIIALLAGVAALAFGRRGRIIAGSIGALLLLGQFVYGGDAVVRGQFSQSVLTIALELAGIYHILVGRFHKSRQ